MTKDATDLRTPVPRLGLSRRSVVRIVLDLLAEELASSRRQSPAVLGAGAWSEATRLDADGLDLDSLERLGASAALSEFFHLQEHGAEDYLLALPSVGQWCDLVEQSLRATGTHLTFRTSGSTGTPKRCTHAIADLALEVDAWADALGPVERIVSLVPSHHIYGTIFSALLPDRLGVDSVRARFGGAGALAHASSGSVVVATPTLWAYASRSLGAFPTGVTGVSSTAPMPTTLAHDLADAGLERLIEIYGSSETGGIARRDDSSSPFRLLGHWRRGGTAGLDRRCADGTWVPVPSMDALAWTDNRRFALAGRRDGAVQIGGNNVFPERVRDRLLDHAGVADVAVRVDSGRLKAFIVPASPREEDPGLVAELDRWCGERFKDSERPRRFALGAALPRNAMGKLADW